MKIARKGRPQALHNGQPERISGLPKVRKSEPQHTTMVQPDCVGALESCSKVRSPGGMQRKRGVHERGSMARRENPRCAPYIPLKSLMEQVVTAITESKQSPPALCEVCEGSNSCMASPIGKSIFSARLAQDHIRSTFCVPGRPPHPHPWGVSLKV